jgi:hypothetical protein
MMTKLLKMLGIIMMIFSLTGIAYAGDSRGLGDLDREDLFLLKLLGGGFDFDKDRFERRFDRFDDFDFDKDRFEKRFDRFDKFDFDKDRFDFDDD